jgi:hypothetical protein
MGIYIQEDIVTSVEPDSGYDTIWFKVKHTLKRCVFWFGRGGFYHDDHSGALSGAYRKKLRIQ